MERKAALQLSAEGSFMRSLSPYYALILVCFALRSVYGVDQHFKRKSAFCSSKAVYRLKKILTKLPYVCKT